MKTLAAFAVTVGLTVAATLPAAGQSVYGCNDLAGRHSIPSVEGADGVFYRIDPDLRNFHPFSDEVIAQLADFSGALAALGTTLIYVPLPTKSLAMPDQLPQAAMDLGFDPDLATTVHDEILRRLRESGIHTVDVRAALRAAPDDQPSFFLTDYRMTAAGGRRTAQAISDALALTTGFTDVPKSLFDTRSGGMVTLASDMRGILQRHCLIALPDVQTETFVTTRFQDGQSTDSTLFGTGGSIALVGTEYSGEPATNLAGFLSEFTGLNVVQYAVADGGSFAAISTYLTSRSFQESRPAYLIWTNPVFENLAQFGDQPMRELIAAAGDQCRVTLPVASGAEMNAVTADLRSLDPGQSYTLFVDADGAQATMAQFDFTQNDGLIRTKSIFRNPQQAPTGRFYMPMSGLSSGGAQTVRIAFDVPVGPNTRVTACFAEGDQ